MNDSIHGLTKIIGIQITLTVVLAILLFFLF